MKPPRPPIQLPRILAGATRRELTAVIRWASSQMARRRLNPSGGHNGGMRPKGHKKGDPACECSTCASKRAKIVRNSNKTK